MVISHFATSIKYSREYLSLSGSIIWMDKHNQIINEIEIDKIQTKEEGEEIEGGKKE